MIVVCKINNLKNVSDVHVLKRLKKYISMPDGEIDLDLGREYIVYGVIFRNNCPWYYLCGADDDEYPKPYSSQLFEIIDDRLSSHWKLSSYFLGENKVTTSLAFADWARDLSFYERLVDGESEAVQIFAQYRKMINQEHT